MIEIFEGRIGGGKSYSAVVRLIGHLCQGGTICTNVELLWDGVANYCATFQNKIIEREQVIVLSDAEIAEFYRHTPSGTPELPVLVVIDEAHLMFNARDWNKTSRETLAFLTQSRKVSTDVIFISQSMFNIDKQFARLAQFIWRFRDMERWVVPFLNVKYPFKQILMAQFDYDGKTFLRRQFIWKDKNIFACYNTNSILRGFPRLEGITTKRQLKSARTGWGARRKKGDSPATLTLPPTVDTSTPSEGEAAR